MRSPKQSLFGLTSLRRMPTAFTFNYQTFRVCSVKAIAVAFGAIHGFFQSPALQALWHLIVVVPFCPKNV
ncbi:hypothetical protein [Nostoc sp.]